MSMKALELGMVALLLTLWGCEADPWGPEELFLGKSSAEQHQLRKGREVYGTYCVGCHGEEGDGKGPAARFLDPKPRDFSKGLLKFAAVASGEGPRDEDYLRVLDHGLSGTAMPEFSLLTSTEKKAVVAYVKGFYPDWGEETAGGEISAGADPWEGDLVAAIEEGQRVYHGYAKCWSCHPAYVSREKMRTIHSEMGLGQPPFRPDLYQPTFKESEVWNAAIKAPDFLIDRMKTGAEVENLARVIASGVGGTAMPTWGQALESEQLWGLAYYVSSLARQRGGDAGAAMMDRLRAADSTERGE